MATTMESVLESPAAEETTKLNYLSFRWVGIGMSGLALVFIAARIYQGYFAWSACLDAFHPDFQTYWMSLFYAELAVVAIVAPSVFLWLWHTRDRAPEKMTAREEVRRLFNQFVWFSSYVFAVYWAASFFPEGDGAWHQTVVRDASLTPSHIVLFYLAFPAYIILGISAVLHAMTRLPHMYNVNRWSLPLLIGVAGPLMMMPNIGFNEWGHTFWIMEELFVAPLHWGFVVFAWSALAFGGITAQIITRVVDITRRGQPAGIIASS